MAAPRYVDLMPSSPGGPMGWIYECTNEDLPTLRDLTSVAIRGGWFLRRAKKVASISSGGEVPLTVLLPAVKSELIAVDHCVGSLVWTMFKAHLLDRHKTVADFKKWLTNVQPDGFHTDLNTFAATLPFVIDTSSQWTFGYRMSDTLTMVRKQWLATPNKALQKTKERLDLITFVHGDLRDIASYGPFDLLYVSNAMAHISKDGAMISADSLKPLLTERGKVISTHDLAPPVRQPDMLVDWPQIKYAKVTCPTTRWGDITWNYHLYQKPLGA